jgi:pimeloyl-ACP methyl ester carboxylesterase
LRGIRALDPDRPGQGLSDPIEHPPNRYRETAVAWVDRLLDTLELDTTTLLGHSGGGAWAQWYALAHLNRVKRLVLINPPALPKTRVALPLRLSATPGGGNLLSRLMPPSPKALLRLASCMGVTLTDATELDRLRERAETEVAEPELWGTIFTLLQSWGRSFIRRAARPR